MRFITSRVAPPAAVIALALSAAPAAWAEEAPASPEIQAARDRFAQAVELVDQERYQEALDIFQELRQTNPHPVVTYNIAWCLSRLSRSSEVITTFEQYLSEGDDDPDRLTRARAELDRLREIQAAENQPPTVDPPTGETEAGDAGTEEPAPRPSRRRLHPAIFYTLLGLTAGAGAACIGTGVEAMSLASDARDQWDLDGDDVFDGTPDVYDQLHGEFTPFADASTAMAVVTGVGAVAALVVGIFTDFHPSRQAARRQSRFARAASLWW